MALMTCPECENQISDQALSCPKCGFQLHQEIVSKQIKENKMPGFHELYFGEVQKKSNFHDSFEANSSSESTPKISSEQKMKNNSVLIALGIVIVAIIYFATSNTPTSSTSWEQEDNRIEAYAMAQQFVEQKLKSPATAKYPLTANECTIRIEGQKYQIDAYVDSQNSYGALIRVNFIAVVEQYEKGKWKLVDLQIN